MAKKRGLNDNDAYHLNFGVPLVLGLILFLINIEFFAIRYVEKLSEIVTIYMYITFIILAVLFILGKKNKEGVRLMKISFYDLAVHNSALVLTFLLLNFSFSEPILERTLEYNINYEHHLIQAKVPPKYLKVFEPSFEERVTYYNKGYHLVVEVNEGIFGYELIKVRKFVENRKLKN